MDKKEEFYIIDTHAHYDDEAFNEDRDELLNNVEDTGIKRVVNIGASMESSRVSLLLAHKYKFVYAAVGVHPSSSEEIDSESILKLEEMLSDEKCVAVGEIGLDYYYDETKKEIQKKSPSHIHLQTSVKKEGDNLFRFIIAERFFEVPSRFELLLTVLQTAT